jgi:hypothetical protein
LLGSIPKLKPLRQSGHAGISSELPERERMKRHNVKARRRRQFQEPYDAPTHLIGGLVWWLLAFVLYFLSRVGMAKASGPLTA